MAFRGTLQKCKACDKTVHVIELFTSDGVPYHKTCFKCSHCNGILATSRYSSMDGVLYCKPHFEQLFKDTGSFTKKFQTSGRPQNDLNRTPSKLSSMFSGTQEKCAVCKKTVYPLEKVTIEGDFYHKSCFRCTHGRCFLTQSSYASLDGFLYCKHHFSQLFKEKGSYNHLTKTASLKKNGAVLPEVKHEEKNKTINSTRSRTWTGPRAIVKMCTISVINFLLVLISPGTLRHVICVWHCPFSTVRHEGVLV